MEPSCSTTFQISSILVTEQSAFLFSKRPPAAPSADVRLCRWSLIGELLHLPSLRLDDRQ
jgi:hypothetical protein